MCFDIALCTWTCGNPPELTLVQDIEHTKIERVLNLSVPRRSIATKTAFPPQALNDVQKKTPIYVVKLDLVATLGALFNLKECCNMQRAQDDDMNDDPLIDEFTTLRRRLFHWQGE